VWKAIAFGLLPFYLYESLGFDYSAYVLGLYLMAVCAGYMLGAMMCGFGLSLKFEKWLLILCLACGVITLLPLVASIYAETPTNVR
jgi:hypothetical protein